MQAVKINLVVKGLDCHYDVFLITSTKLVDKKTMDLVVVRSHSTNIITIDADFGYLTRTQIVN